jgi:hypothetical protein
MDTMQTVWQALAVNALQIAGGLLVTYLGYLIRKYVKDKSMADALESSMTKGVAWAEEQGRKALKNGSPIKGDTKLELALEFVLRELQDRGYPELAREKLTRYLEAKLAAERAAPNGVVPSDPMDVIELVDDGTPSN